MQYIGKRSCCVTEIQKDVVAALAPSQINMEHMNCDEELLAQRNDPSFKKFISGLASSNSDKSFHLKRQFSHILPPIEENVTENDDLFDEQVDYGSSGESGESSQATDMPFITPGQWIFALAVPFLRHEHTADGSQPEVECTQEELASQVDNPQMLKEINRLSCLLMLRGEEAPGWLVREAHLPR
jgi:hypothetical protein